MSKLMVKQIETLDFENRYLLAELTNKDLVAILEKTNQDGPKLNAETLKILVENFNIRLVK